MTPPEELRHRVPPQNHGIKDPSDNTPRPEGDPPAQRPGTPPQGMSAEERTNEITHVFRNEIEREIKGTEVSWLRNAILDAITKAEAAVRNEAIETAARRAYSVVHPDIKLAQLVQDEVMALLERHSSQPVEPVTEAQHTVLDKLHGEGPY